jgi:hypothetical protein
MREDGHAGRGVKVGGATGATGAQDVMTDFNILAYPGERLQFFGLGRANCNSGPLGPGLPLTLTRPQLDH